MKGAALLAILDAVESVTGSPPAAPKRTATTTTAKKPRKRKPAKNKPARKVKAVATATPTGTAMGAPVTLPQSIRDENALRQLKLRKAASEMLRAEKREKRAEAAPTVRSVGTMLELITDSLGQVEWAITEAIRDRKWGAVSSLRKQAIDLRREGAKLVESSPMSALHAAGRERKFIDVTVPRLPTVYLEGAAAELRRRNALLIESDE